MTALRRLLRLRTLGGIEATLMPLPAFAGEKTDSKQSLVSTTDRAPRYIEPLGEEAGGWQAAIAGQRPSTDCGGKLPLDLLSQTRRSCGPINAKLGKCGGRLEKDPVNWPFSIDASGSSLPIGEFSNDLRR